MMWFMPTYGRPERLKELLGAPGGWPPTVTLLINADDPKRAEYERVFAAELPRIVPWKLHYVPEGSRCADVHRYITTVWPNEEFYGLLCDDQWPETSGWYERLVEAAGPLGFATPAGEPSFPLMRTAVCLGGQIVRAMGSIVPIPVRHNFEDNVWDTIAQDFGLLKPCPDVIVRHRHHVHGTAPLDATYERGSADFADDERVFVEWHRERGKSELYARIAEATGTKLAAVDPKGIRLVLALPCGDGSVDIAFHRSMLGTVSRMHERGFSLGLVQSALNSHVGKGRETVLWRAMREGATHILFIDSDMGWDPELVIRLLAADHEFCGAVGCKKQDDLQLCLNPLPNPQKFHERSGFLEVRDVGFAFIMLKRSVIEKLCAAYPELRYNAGPHEEYALFMDLLDKSDTHAGPYGERLSEDLSFCRRWRAIGGSIWIDPNAALVHAGRKEYVGRLRDVLKPIEQSLAQAAE